MYLFTATLLEWSSCSFQTCGAPQHLPTSPTRRSSHLPLTPIPPTPKTIIDGRPTMALPWNRRFLTHRPAQPAENRSEEHTSELKSRQYLVCRLLLEEKEAPPGILA